MHTGLSSCVSRGTRFSVYMTVPLSELCRASRPGCSESPRPYTASDRRHVSRNVWQMSELSTASADLSYLNSGGPGIEPCCHKAFPSHCDQQAGIGHCPCRGASTVCSVLSSCVYKVLSFRWPAYEVRLGSFLRSQSEKGRGFPDHDLTPELPFLFNQ